MRAIYHTETSADPLQPQSMRSFAIVPAAGRSARMGSPKLLLPWKGRTVFEHVLETWQSSQVESVVVVIHPTDTQLAAMARSIGAHVVVPSTPPPDMKSSVQHGLGFCRDHFKPQPEDAWLLAPADMPAFTVETINHLLDQFAALPPMDDRPILVPSYGGKQGHPVIFPWAVAVEVDALASDEGINALTARHQPIEVPVADDGILSDLDIPDDYTRLHNRYDPS